MLGRNSEAFTVRVGDSLVSIRESEPEDRARSSAVQWAAGWADPPVRHRWWPEADAEWQAHNYFRELIAEVDGVVAARVGLEAYRQPFAEIINLCVRPDFRRLGIAEMLTRRCQEEAAKRGFVGLYLQTEMDNVAAHRLYTGLDFVPTAHGKMLRMLKFIDYPLLADFRRSYPLNQYVCSPVADEPRVWNPEWHAYTSDDHLRFRFEGGASQSDSDGVAPALTGFDWKIGRGMRAISVRLEREAMVDLEPGNHVALEITLTNSGRHREAGVFQMVLPQGVRVSSPATNSSQVFAWEAGPGESVVQPVVVHIEPSFDNSPLWFLNYPSLSVCMETFWQGHRGMVSTSLPMAAPPPPD